MMASCKFGRNWKTRYGELKRWRSPGRGRVAFLWVVKKATEQKLKFTVDQAKSLALMLGVPYFVVAAPEGFWIYSLDHNRERLELEVREVELGDRSEEIRTCLLRLRR